MKINYFYGQCSSSQTVNVYQRVNLHFPMVFLWFTRGYLEQFPALHLPHLDHRCCPTATPNPSRNLVNPKSLDVHDPEIRSGLEPIDGIYIYIHNYLCIYIYVYIYIYKHTNIIM